MGASTPVNNRIISLDSTRAIILIINRILPDNLLHPHHKHLVLLLATHNNRHHLLPARRPLHQDHSHHLYLPWMSWLP